MAQISRLSRLFNGISRGVDLTANTLVVQDIQIGGLSGTTLTKTILDRFVSLQDGTTLTAGTYHLHHATDALYDRLDASKKDIQGTSDDIEAALDDLDDAKISKTGAIAFTGDQAMGTHKLTGLSAGSASGHSVRYEQAVLVSGANAFAADQSMGGNKVTSMANGTSSGDAVNKSQLDAVQSMISGFQWEDSVITRTLTTPPGSPSSGDRYLIGLDTSASAATGAWAGKDGQIAEWNGSAWVFTVPTLGTYISADDENDGLYLFGGTVWVKKFFEATTASTGLTKSGFDIQLDTSAAGSGLTFTAGVLSVNVDNSTVELNSSTIRVKDAGITTAKIAANAVDDTLIRLRSAQFLRARNAANSADVNLLRLNSSDVIEFASLPQSSGTPTNANDLVNKSYADSLSSGVVSTSVIAGASFSANTTYAVRWAVSGETAGRVYAADDDATSADNFHVVGLLKVGTALSAGDSATLTMLGVLSQASGDTAFGSTDIGKPVYLNSSGAWSVTPSGTAGHANVIVGYVKTTTVMDVKSLQIQGVN